MCRPGEAAGWVFGLGRETKKDLYLSLPFNVHTTCTIHACMYEIGLCAFHEKENNNKKNQNKTK